ncbi:PadR family transcriptional regulator [Microbacterium sp. No. 7]|uniref:PadR family transcriptional regulator n=1 Tax=Microbacterium sp. No. 7 TaxID=1714373 RepID=UPI0006D20C2E|nr:PadR family transcriptional regulator [Microbacterium sp. No. 7]ALJ22156.1 transcriptional regulator [Microbacterium sp. No. 7]
MPDAVARLTPLGIVVLGLLREDDMHPYEMMRLIRHRRDDRLVRVSHGALYHTVARLGGAGLITEVGTERDGNRPERTTYALNEAGRAAAEAWVRRELGRIDRGTEFRVALAEAHVLPRDEVAALLRTRRDALAEQLEQLRAGLARAGARGIPYQFLVEGDRDRALLDADLRWTDGLLAALADPALPWGARELPEQTLRLLADHRKSTSQ